MPDEVYLTTTETPGGNQDRGVVRMEGAADHDAYEIVGHESSWHVVYEGERSLPYASKEAAFEAAVTAASSALKNGHDVTIHVAGRRAGESAFGNQAN